MDVKSDLLNEILEEVNIDQPKGFIDPNKRDMVCKLPKALHGLKQAPRAWYERLHNYLIQIGFQRKMITALCISKKDQKRRLCWLNYLLMTHY